MAEERACIDLLNDATRRHQLAQYYDAERIYRKCKSLCEAELGPRHYLTQRTLENLARLYATLWQLDKCKRLRQSLCEMKESALGALHPERARILRWLSELERTESNHAEADRLMDLSTHIWNIELDAVAGEHEAAGDFFGEKTKSLADVKLIEQHLRTKLEAQRETENLQFDLVRQLCEVGAMLCFKGNNSTAAQLFEAALAAAPAVGAESLWDCAWAVKTLSNLYLRSGQAESARKLVANHLAALNQAFGETHDMASELYLTLGRCLREQEKYAEAEEMLNRSLELHQKTLDSPHPSSATILFELASLSALVGQIQKSEQLLRQSICAKESALGFEHPDLAGELQALGDILLAKGEPVEAESVIQRAARLLRSSYGPNSLQMASALDKLGDAYLQQFAYGKSETMYLRSQEIKLLCLPPDHLECAAISSRLGSLYQLWGKPIDSEAQHKQAITLYTKHNKPILTAELKLKLSNLYFDQRRDIEAEKICREALETFEDLEREDLELDALIALTKILTIREKLAEAERAGNRAVEILNRQEIDKRATRLNQAQRALAQVKRRRGSAPEAKVLLNEAIETAKTSTSIGESALAVSELCRLHLSRGEYAEAEKLFEYYYGKVDASTVKDDPLRADFLELSAQIKLAKRSTQEALAMQKQALKIRESSQGEHHPASARSLLTLSAIYFKSGAEAEAELCCHKALQSMERCLQPNHPDLGFALCRLASVLIAREKETEAIRLIQRALLVFERSQPCPSMADLLLLKDLAVACAANRLLKESAALRAPMLKMSAPALQSFGAAAALALLEAAQCYASSGAMEDALRLLEAITEASGDHLLESQNAARELTAQLQANRLT